MAASAAAVLLIAALLAADAARAQQVLGSSTIGDQSGADTPANAAPLAIRADEHLPLFRWGDIQVRPHGHYTRVHATSLRSPQGIESDADIDTFALGVLLNLGEHWNADYTRSWMRYSAQEFRDSVAQHLRADGRMTRSDWAGSFSQRYSSTDTTIAETARQTRRERSDTVASASMHVAPRWTAGMSLSQRLGFIETLSDTYEWSARPDLMYQVSNSVSAGLGTSAGYVLIYDAPDMRYVSPAAQAMWRMTERTSLQVMTGWSYYEYVGGPNESIDGLTYSAALSYAPFQQTMLSVSATRGISATHFANQASESEQISARLSQRLFRHFRLSLGMGDQTTRYIAGIRGSPVVRRDRFRSYDAALRTTFLSRITAGVTYRYSRNRSGNAFYTFSSRQVGFEIGVRF